MPTTRLRKATAEEGVTREDRNEGEKKKENVSPSKKKRRSMKVDSKRIKGYVERPSLLSSEVSAHTFRGFINLAMILLVVSNFREVIYNIVKYGWLISFQFFIVEDYANWNGAIIAFSLNIYILLAWAMEKRMSVYQRGVVVRGYQFVQILNCAAAVVITSVAIIKLKVQLGTSILVMSLASIVFMKLVSYAHVNYLLRHDCYEAAEVPPRLPGELNYPENVTILNLYTFLIMPTLVYQLEYPRSGPIRWGWVCRRVVELSVLSALQVMFVEQYIVPLCKNAIAPFAEQNFMKMAERILKLAIPNFYLWLIGFYCFFHLTLNITAELTHFGDRSFYSDWWNSTTLGYFWRSWNLPVHHWVMVHLYFPAIRFGFSQRDAGLWAFFVSAVFHELVISVPFRSLKLWAFSGMMAQIPLIYLTRGLDGHNVGNIIFWLSLVLGQPFCVLMYYRDYIIENLEAA